MAYHCVVLQCVTYYCFYIDTKASEKLSSIIQNRRFCGDMKKLSPLYQTSACEAFQCGDQLCTKVYCLHIQWNAFKVIIRENYYGSSVWLT